MRVLLSTYDSRGGVEPLAGLAVRLRALGAEVRVCAPPDCAERLAEVGVPLVPVGAPVRPLVHGATPAARAGAPQVVVPHWGDQPYWAGRVAELGIGTAHDGPAPTTESLSAALRTALTPETRARATAMTGAIRTDRTMVAATLLLDAANRERSPVSA
jgi:UDP:flavonoid glycosyltransferase YjiC (YdhE family)